MPLRKIRVCEVLEATEGGTREHLRQIAACLDRTQFDLTFIVSPLRAPDFEDDIAHMREQGLRVHVVPMQRAISPAADLTACLRIWHILRQRRVDIVHTHSAKAGILGRAAAWLAGVPVRIHTPHVLPFQQEITPWLRRVYRQTERVAGRISTKLIALSAHEREVMLLSGIARPGQIEVIHNAVEPAPGMSAQAIARKRREIGVAADAFVVGCVGRLVEQKGHTYLVRCARRVAEAAPDAQFVLVGDGPLRTMLSDEIERLGLGERFHLLGYRDDVRALLPTFDVFALPSLWEAMPYTILEAMDAALPVVAFDVCGLGEFVHHGEHGLLVRAKDSLGLAEAILALAGNRPMRERMGKQGQMAVRRETTIGRFVASLEGLYLGR